MERRPRKIIFTIIGVIFFILIIIFGYNRFGRYINGPEIVEISLDEYQTVDTLDLTVTGRLRNVHTLFINNRSITLNQDNSFQEILALSPGLTKIDILVSDTFNKERRYLYNVYSTKDNDSYATSYQEAILEIEPTEIPTNQ